MSTSSLTTSELNSVVAFANANPDKPAAIWALLAHFGDQYAQAAYAGLTEPTSTYGLVIANSNAVSGVSEVDKLRNMQAVAQGYVRILQDTDPNADGTIRLPTTTEIEENYYRASISVGLKPINAIDLSIAVLAKNDLTGGVNWYTWALGVGLNLDPSRIGPPADVLANISAFDAAVHFLWTSEVTGFSEPGAQLINGIAAIFWNQDQKLADAIHAALKAKGVQSGSGDNIDLMLTEKLSSALTNSNIGKAIGLQKDISGSGSESYQLMTAIAFSSLGVELPFGDAAFDALFDDVNQLGKVYKGAVNPQLAGGFLSNFENGGVKGALAEILVQHAGDLAKQQSTDAAARNGVFELLDNGTRLKADFDFNKWKATFNKDGLTGGGEKINGVGSLAKALVTDIAEQHVIFHRDLLPLISAAAEKYKADTSDFQGSYGDMIRITEIGCAGQALVNFCNWYHVTVKPRDPANGATRDHGRAAWRANPARGRGRGRTLDVQAGVAKIGRFLAMVFVASVALGTCGRAAEAAQNLGLSGGRFQVGDLVFQIPETQKVTAVTGSLSEDYADYPSERLDKSARQIRILSIQGSDAFKLSGTHGRGERGPENSEIQIIVRKNDRANETGDWCRKPLPSGVGAGGRFLRPENALERSDEFYVYGKPEWNSRTLVAAGPHTFFFAPVVLHKTNVGSPQSPSYSYNSYVALSKHVAFEVRFGDMDLHDITIFDLLKNVELAVMSWRAPAGFSPRGYAHENPAFCAD